MSPLRRHALVWLDEYGWYRVLAPAPGEPTWDAQARECIEVWAARGLPLVVTRQPAGWTGDGRDEPLTLGLPAPARWGRRRLFIETSTGAVVRRGEFAPAAALAPRLPDALQPGWARLCAGLESLHATALVYGSHGWQHLTGLDYVHERSDIDLLVGVDTPSRSDSVVGLLDAAAFDNPRIDGEIEFADGRSVAWREWARSRAGQARQVLVKRIHGAALQKTAHWTAA